ncbi:MAG: CpaF family protein [Eggerthellales bacterium]|nr:CpaF family protein [Eggerthellales bacterium]
MSLMDRVSKAQGNDIAALELSDEELFLELRRRMNQQLPDGLVSAAATASLRVENEIRSLCQSAFAQPEWAGVSLERRQRLTDQLIDSVFGFGPLNGLLADGSVTEIMVNAFDKVFVERHGVLEQTDVRFVDKDQVRALMDRIVGPLGRRIDESSPMVNARLPQGFRVNAIIEPISVDGPVLTIRKFPDQLMRLEDMAQSGSIEPTLLPFLRWAVAARKNVAVSGGTGSGKTTFLNALSCFIPQGERVITIEDSAELRFAPSAHVVRLEARPMNAEGMGQVTIGDLVANALRMRPDRIVVGEVRGAEALDMLQAMNTGHDGSLTTLHANSTKEAVSRLVTMVRYSSEVPVEVVESYIATALDVVVQTARSLDGRRYVCEIASFSFDEERRRCVVERLYQRLLPDDAGLWLAVPSWVDELPRYGYVSQEEVDAWKRQISCL